MQQFQNANGSADTPAKTGLSGVVESLVSGSLVAKKIVWRKTFSGSTRYQFCPFCIRDKGVRKRDIDRFLKLKFSKKRLTEDEQAFMEATYRKLSALEAVRYKLLIRVSDAFGAVAYETGFRCPHCGSDVEIADLENFWCRQADRNAGEKKYIRLDSGNWQAEFYGGAKNGET